MQNHPRGASIGPAVRLTITLLLATAVLTSGYDVDTQIGKAFDVSINKLHRRRIYKKESHSIERSKTITSQTYKVTSTSSEHSDFEHDGSDLLESINYYDPKVPYQRRYRDTVVRHDRHPTYPTDYSSTVVVQRPDAIQQQSVLYPQVQQIPIVQPIVIRPSVIQPEPQVVVVNPQVIEQPVIHRIVQPVIQPTVQPVIHQVIQPHPTVITQTIPIVVNPYGTPPKESDLDKLLNDKIQEAKNALGPNAIVTGSVTVTPVKSLAQTGFSSSSRLTSKRGQLKSRATSPRIQLAQVRSESEGLHTVTRRRRLASKPVQGTLTNLAKVNAGQMSSNGHRLSSTKGRLQSTAPIAALSLAETSATTIGVQPSMMMEKQVNFAQASSTVKSQANLRGQLGDHTADTVTAAQKLLHQQTSTSTATTDSGSSQTAQQASTASNTGASSASSKVASAMAQSSSTSAKVTSLERPSPLQKAPALEEQDDLDDEPTPSRLVSLAQTNKSGLAAMKTVGNLRSASYITSFASVKEVQDEGLLNTVNFN